MLFCFLARFSGVRSAAFGRAGFVFALLAEICSAVRASLLADLCSAVRAALSAGFFALL